MKKKLLFVFNPYSGKAQLKNKLFEIIDTFTKQGYIVTVHPTQAPQDAFNLIKSQAYLYDIIVISGGDGTLKECVSAMMEYPLPERKPIGYIPSGTTNDFASSRNIPKDITKAVDKIINGSVITEDVGILNEKVFNYVAAFGAFTDVSYDTPQGAKNILGHAAYIFEGIKRLQNIESVHVHVTCGEIEIDDYFCFGCVLNSTSMAGISFDGKYAVELDDGLFEAVLVKLPVTILQAQEIIQAVMHGEEDTERFRVIRGSSLVFEFDDEIKWTLDGEYGGSHKQVSIKVENKAIRFIR